ncbi:PilZ domain-containing protein [Sphingomonas yantingensis]|uniref:PilZ domain-containing protein n=1 Tax=Sphingomonas yantingensis TaxID=1241761 RepID=A0A7W9EJR8_9SPHN|nr:PilZ domain-containing protein [Sphingomonas yantingensis]MBB5699315.1 hypothetical protein [Sphingomonas yantingensis]
MRSTAAQAAHTSHRRAHEDDREVERKVLGRRGVLRIGDDPQPYDVMILDLTRDGCGIQCHAPVESGTPIEVGIANVGRILGTVLWHGPDSFGCMFDHPLPAGSVTAAFGPRNVLPFPRVSDATVRPDPATKLAVRTRLLLIAGATSLCWSAIGAVVLALA